MIISNNTFISKAGLQLNERDHSIEKIQWNMKAIFTILSHTQKESYCYKGALIQKSKENQ